ncbi:hypothetical protein NDN08_007876 [Rhodosorus marinus]|uniref:Photolyase/cryptochrome alpha/beta domain-containing protein n=2 Tax=Rhodosorus marinus TaxID=101924 RepID=A0AAV8V1L5_9RHOD|nr:hypothetical protein NDN08_007876 [Rhodosorus marinus]
MKRPLQDHIPVAMKLALKKAFSSAGERVVRMRKLTGTVNSLVEDVQGEEFVICAPKELPTLTRGPTLTALRERSQNLSQAYSGAQVQQGAYVNSGVQSTVPSNSNTYSMLHSAGYSVSGAYSDQNEGSLAALAHVASHSRSLSTSRGNGNRITKVIMDSSAPQKRTRKGYPRRKPKEQRRPAIVWFRGHDLRISDHPALLAASRHGGPVVPVFIWSPSEWSLGRAGRWWLHNSLKSLAEDLANLGLELTVRTGKTYGTEIDRLVEETGADTVFWHRVYEPELVQISEKIQAELKKKNVASSTFKSELLVEPWDLKDANGEVYQTLPSYVAAWMALPPPPPPLSAPRHLNRIETKLESVDLESLQLIADKSGDADLRETWKTGSSAALEVLDRFLTETFPTFGDSRCRRDLNGTSKLSPYLRFGEISPRKVYHAVRQQTSKVNLARARQGDKESRQKAFSDASRAFLKNLCMRDFAHHMYYTHPKMAVAPIVPEFSVFPWSDDFSTLPKWREGQTGYPIIDAAMRQLRKIGWVHNSLRYLLASFVTKYLLLPWHVGVTEFAALLVDGEAASNALGWQWSFGSNLDSFPVNCLVNPTGVGQKQDPTGFFIRQWVPELRDLPNQYIHNPSQAPKEVLEPAGVKLGETYPMPIIETAAARQRTREAARQMKIRWSAIQCTSAKMTAVAERPQDWPEDELEHIPVQNEQITNTNIGLLPSLWQMVHYDPSPPDLSQSFRMASSFRTLGRVGSSPRSGTTYHSHRNPYAGVSSGGGSDTTMQFSKAPVVPNYAAHFPMQAGGTSSTADIIVPPGVNVAQANSSAPSNSAYPSASVRESSWQGYERRGMGQVATEDTGKALSAGYGSSSRNEPRRKRQRPKNEARGAKVEKNSPRSQAAAAPAKNMGEMKSKLTLADRNSILRSIAENRSDEYYSLARFIAEYYELTENVDRTTSKDYVRLCTMKDEYHKECKFDQSKVKIYKMKNFFSKILQLEVTGEWDRHKQGGVRGPYVYGLRSIVKSGPPSAG